MTRATKNRDHKVFRAAGCRPRRPPHPGPLPQSKSRHTGTIKVERKTAIRFGGEGAQKAGSIGGIEIGILADFALHFFAFFLVMQQHHAVAKVLAFDLRLGFAEDGAKL